MTPRFAPTLITRSTSLATALLVAASSLAALSSGCRGDKKDGATTDNAPNKPVAPPPAESDLPQANDLLNGLGQKAPPSAQADLAKIPADAEKDPSGLASKVLKPGDGAAHPDDGSSVTVNLAGYTADGRQFESTEGRGAVKVTLGQLPKGLQIGIKKMVAGEKRRLWIPEELAYKGMQGKPQGPLVFDVDLVDMTAGVAAPEDVKTPPKDAEKSKSGLAWKVLKKGTGTKHPSEQDNVRVDFSAWTADGQLLDSTRGEPTTLPISAIPSKGWTEAITSMVPGEKRRIWIPQELAIDKPGAPKGPLTMDVELFDIKEGPKPIAAPPDVKAPPADAEKTASGLVSKVLTKGTGTTHPGPTSAVEVHYTGWTTDGKMFDSSVARGEPEKLTLNGVIPGWTEGVQLMVEGEKRRFWIPEALAYHGQPGAPAGTLVFDVELLKILRR